MKKLFTLLSLFFVVVATAQPNRTPTFTGNVGTDFKPYEKMLTSSFTYAITWDAKYVYIGVTDNNAYVKNEPTIVYIDTLGSGGRDTGFDYDGRRPILPFSANAVIFFKGGVGNYYAEVRRDSAVGWKGRKEFTANIDTGSTDIEIKLPWTALTGKAQPPAQFGALFFKENGNTDPNQANPHDAYNVRPGIDNVNNTYTTNVQDATKKIDLYFKFKTENKYYTGLSLFNWIANHTGDLCTKPVYAATPETNITKTSAKVNWTATTGAKQYQVRYRVAGSNAWRTKVVAGTATNTLLSGLSCATTYNWFVRDLCDTSNTSFDIASAFTTQRTFSTPACFSFERGVAPGETMESAALTVYPVPARKGSMLTVSSQQYRTNSGYTIYSVSGQKVQQGTLNSNTINLSSEVAPGNYILELRNSSSVTRNKIVIAE